MTPLILFAKSLLFPSFCESTTFLEGSQTLAVSLSSSLEKRIPTSQAKINGLPIECHFSPFVSLPSLDFIERLRLPVFMRHHEDDDNFNDVDKYFSRGSFKKPVTLNNFWSTRRSWQKDLLFGVRLTLEELDYQREKMRYPEPQILKPTQLPSQVSKGTCNCSQERSNDNEGKKKDVMFSQSNRMRLEKTVQHQKDTHVSASRSFVSLEQRSQRKVTERVTASVLRS